MDEFFYVPSKKLWVKKTDTGLILLFNIQQNTEQLPNVPQLAASISTSPTRIFVGTRGASDSEQLTSDHVCLECLKEHVTLQILLRQDTE